MIQFADNSSIEELKTLWKICFEDTDEYIELIFSSKYKPENTLIYKVEDKIVASLQMQEYNFRMYGQVIPCYYLVGLCTLPDFRNAGYMGKLINKSIGAMIEREIPISILIPAEGWLIKYYNKFGFEQTFDKGSTPIDLKPIIEKHSNLSDQFDEFDKKYQQKDFTLLKKKEDFEVIVKEYIADGSPLKYNQMAMALSVDTFRLLSIFAENNQKKSFFIEIEGENKEKSPIYSIKSGKVDTFNKYPDKVHPHIIKTSKQLFTQLIMGYQTGSLHDELSDIFKEKHPIINLMLE